MTTWKDFPNAKYISTIMSHVNQHKDAFIKHDLSARHNNQYDLRDAVDKAWWFGWDRLRDLDRSDIFSDLRFDEARSDKGFFRVQFTLMSLAAWDNSPIYLTNSEEELRFLSALGVDAATLLVPAAQLLSYVEYD